MSTRKPGVRHLRNGIVDVAVCGARDGMLMMAWGLVDCAACRAKRNNPGDRARWAARVAHEKGAKRRAQSRPAF